MDPKKLAEGSKPRKLGRFLARLPGGHEHHAAGESVREDDHRGHRIVIRTTYRIEVDGRPIRLPLVVDNEGHVHGHSLPNYQFTSAVDLVKTLIDTYPEDFQAPPRAARSAKKRAKSPRGKSPRAKSPRAKRGR